VRQIRLGHPPLLHRCARAARHHRPFIADYLKEKNLPGLDVLVNKCVAQVLHNYHYSPLAHPRASAPSAAIPFAPFEATFAVNLFGTVAITAAIRPLLSNNGAILNISSTLVSLHAHTQRPHPPLFAPYSVSKAALNAVTLQWAIEEEEKRSGVWVVAICPGTCFLPVLG
jgi:NAD(P)-dependent dehydrogenase (short-subunit alcohol dehydrogenase family)